MVGVGRALCGSPSPTPCPSRVTQSRVHSTASSRGWNISREGDSPAPLGSLGQGSVENERQQHCKLIPDQALSEPRLSHSESIPPPARTTPPKSSSDRGEMLLGQKNGKRKKRKEKKGKKKPYYIPSLATLNQCFIHTAPDGLTSSLKRCQVISAVLTFYPADVSWIVRFVASLLLCRTQTPALYFSSAKHTEESCSRVHSCSAPDRGDAPRVGIIL